MVETDVNSNVLPGASSTRIISLMGPVLSTAAGATTGQGNTEPDDAGHNADSGTSMMAEFPVSLAANK